MNRTKQQIIEDYADRIIGGGVQNSKQLVDYYLSTPSDIPEPFDPKLFVKYASEIKCVIKRGNV